MTCPICRRRPGSAPRLDTTAATLGWCVGCRANWRTASRMGVVFGAWVEHHTTPCAKCKTAPRAQLCRDTRASDVYLCGRCRDHAQKNRATARKREERKAAA